MSVTADVIYALALSGEEPGGSEWTPPGGQSALAALARLAPGYVGTDAGQAGKVARAAVLAGANPRSFGGLNLLGIIQAAYDPATGRYHPKLLYRHTLAVEALIRMGETVPQAALNALARAQLPAGGWFWSFDATQADVDTTGRVLQLLTGIAGGACSSGIRRATDYLAAAVHPMGGWGVYPPPNPNAPNANSTALAVAGLRAAGYDPDGVRFQAAGAGGLTSLLAFQEASGAFVYIRQAGNEEVRLMATADALAALAQPAVTPSSCKPVYLPVLLDR